MLRTPPLFVALFALVGCFNDGGGGAEGTTSEVGTTAGSGPTSGGAGEATVTTTVTTGPMMVTGDATSAGETTDGPGTSGGETGPVVSDCAGEGACFNVINRCAVPLWIHAANPDGALAPDNAVVGPGEVLQLAVPGEWSAGRVNAFWADPDKAPEAHDKVEVTYIGGVMNYNITYVDYVGLPAEMVAVGPECVTTEQFDPKIGCDVAREALLQGCPDGLRSGDRCLSAGLHCADPVNADSEYCHALDQRIKDCGAQHPDTCGVAETLNNGTWHVYACAGYFDSQPPNCMPATPDCHFEGNKWCAALNRGMLDDPESTDVAAYYQTPPFNTYAKWVHETCPGIYAFAYDDYPANAGESGFRACKADRLDITFCPVG